jgi:hypothetical protein
MENSKRTTKEVAMMLTESEIEAITIHMEANPCSRGMLSERQIRNAVFRRLRLPDERGLRKGHEKAHGGWR